MVYYLGYGNYVAGYGVGCCNYGGWGYGYGYGWPYGGGCGWGRGCGWGCGSCGYW